MSDEQFLSSQFLPRFHLFSHKLKLKSVNKLHLEIRGGALQNPQDPLATGLCKVPYSIMYQQACWRAFYHEGDLYRGDNPSRLDAL